MELLAGLLSIVAGVGSLVCAIIILIKIFREEGVLQGVLALFCSLYAYIWGWIKREEHNLTDLMFIWTILILLSVVLSLVIDPQGFVSDF